MNTAFVKVSIKRTWMSLAMLVWAGLAATTSWASNPSDTLVSLQREWAQIKYRLPEKQQAAQFENLIGRAEAATSANPNSADLWVWSGIIRASYAGAKGGLGALSAVKAAKADLEHAIALNGSVQDGAAYTSLGSLYYQVPGWPIGFGDDKKAETFLKKGLEYGANDIDANYFYADYLFKHKDYPRAMEYLSKAEHAPKDLARPLASEGRMGEILKLKALIQEKLH
ncbi:tetratricopeptide repeat protein [Microbulbifer sp. SA54]|uniref:tetratricopeptide repeat protein n=1 Tax=Microbulbifer sp. SA54 TaxID=3401577 RepID=UPI003AAE6A2C